jgi:hypothetical protein
MNPRLEQLRKRLLTPVPSSGSSNNIFSNSPEATGAESSEQPLSSSEAAVGDQVADAEESTRVHTEPPSEQSATRDTKATVGALKPADQLAQSVVTLFEPARRYRERVSLSIESLRGLHVELGVLAQSFEPLREIHGRVLEFLNALRVQLADTAMSLEAAKALRLQLSELVQVLDTETELQAQIYELSRALGVTLQGAGANPENNPAGRPSHGPDRRATGS